MSEQLQIFTTQQAQLLQQATSLVEQTKNFIQEAERHLAYIEALTGADMSRRRKGMNGALLAINREMAGPPAPIVVYDTKKAEEITRSRMRATRWLFEALAGNSKSAAVLLRTMLDTVTAWNDEPGKAIYGAAVALLEKGGK